MRRQRAGKEAWVDSEGSHRGCHSPTRQKAPVNPYLSELGFFFFSSSKLALKEDVQILQ